MITGIGTSMNTFIRSFLLVLFWTIFVNSSHSETLDQVDADQDNNIFRVTKYYSNEFLDVDLFGMTSGGVLFWKLFEDIVLGTGGEHPETLKVQMSFLSDPAWNRIVYGDRTKWLKAYGEWGSGAGQYKHPEGLDMSYRGGYYIGPQGLLFVADSGNDRISVETFELSPYHAHYHWYTEFSELVHAYEISDGGSMELHRPQDVAFDDGGTETYFEDDCLWVADTGNDRIVKYSVSDTEAEFVLEYGGSGGGTGQFDNPISICRGKNQGLSDEYIYVIDSTNRRIVMLENEAGSMEVNWYGTYDYSAESWQLKSIRSDWYGQIWATDCYSSSIIKFTRYLDFLDEYGEYGLGQVEGKLNHPTMFSPSTMVTMTSAGQEVEEIARSSRAFTVEQWGDESGATAYRMGPDALDIQHVLTPNLRTVIFGYRLTDHCSHLTERIYDMDANPVRLLDDTTWAASGDRIISWNRRKSSGYMMEPGDYFLRIWMDSGYNDGTSETREYSFSLPLYYYEMCGQGYPYDRHWEDGTSWNWGDGHYGRIDTLGVEVKYKYDSTRDGLDPDKYYKMKATYYFGDYGMGDGSGNGRNWKEGAGETPLSAPGDLEEELWIDNTMIHDALEIPRYSSVTTSWYYVPPEEYQDGQIYIYIKKVAGGVAWPAVVEFIEIRETDEYIEPQDPDTNIYVVGTHQWGNRSGKRDPDPASSDSVSMVYRIDMTTGELIDSVRVGDEPTSLSSIEINGGFHLIVANSGSGDMSIIDVNNWEAPVTMDSGGDEPTDAIFGKRGGVMYVANYASSTMVKLSPDGEILGILPVGAGPSHLALSPDGSLLYVQSDLDNRIDMVDTGTDSLLFSVDLDQPPVDMELAPGGRFMIVSHGMGGILTIVDVRSHNVISTISTEGHTIQKTLFSADDQILFAIDPQDDLILVFNTDGEMTDSIEVGDGPTDMELAQNGSVLLVSNSLERTISRIDVGSRREILPRLELGEIRPGNIEVRRGSFRNHGGEDRPNLLGGMSTLDMPKVFSLLQNYPNPFNPSTTIRYDIPGNEDEKTVRVLMKIFNIRGRLVKTLVDTEKEPGRYSAVWDGRNERGETVSSGIYLYRIEADTFHSIRKMVLLK